MNAKEMYEMRMNGRTFQEIADVCGISKQRVHQRVKAHERKVAGIRGKGFDINQIVYKGIYEHFLNDFDESLNSFCKKVKGGQEQRHFVLAFKGLITGKNARFSVSQIKAICDVVGKPFDKCFERR